MRVDTEFEPLVTERLILRRSRPEDAEAISAYRSDPAVNRYQGWDRTDPEGIRAEIEEMESRLPGGAGGWVQFTVDGRRMVNRAMPRVCHLVTPAGFAAGSRIQCCNG